MIENFIGRIRMQKQETRSRRCTRNGVRVQGVSSIQDLYHLLTHTTPLLGNHLQPLPRPLAIPMSRLPLFERDLQVCLTPTYHSLSCANVRKLDDRALTAPSTSSGERVRLVGLADLPRRRWERNSTMALYVEESTIVARRTRNEDDGCVEVYSAKSLPRKSLSSMYQNDQLTQVGLPFFVQEHFRGFNTLL
jgi:hypothetical protein